jgi:hypothetical protein
MVEVVFATAIVGSMIVASLDAAGMIFHARRLNASGTTGPALAQELLEEVLAMPYEDSQFPGGSIGLEGGESAGNRATFDDVDDYHNWNAANAVNRSGAAIAGFTGWRRRVDVEYVQLGNPAQPSGSDAGLKRVTVTVTSPTGALFTATGLRARYGALEQKPGLTSAPVTWLGAELQAGDATTAERRAARPLNHSSDTN